MHQAVELGIQVKRHGRKRQVCALKNSTQLDGPKDVHRDLRKTRGMRPKYEASKIVAGVWLTGLATNKNRCWENLKTSPLQEAVKMIATVYF